MELHSVYLVGYSHVVCSKSLTDKSMWLEFCLDWIESYGKEHVNRG